MNVENNRTIDLHEDVWTSVFLYLNIVDFLAVRSCCHHFNKLTDQKRYRKVNQFWKSQCSNLCPDIKSFKFDTNDWFEFFLAFAQFLKSCFKYPFNFDHEYNFYVDARCIYKYNQDDQSNDTSNKYTFPVTFGGTDDEFEVLKYEKCEKAIIMACQDDNILMFKFLSYYLEEIDDCHQQTKFCYNWSDLNILPTVCEYDSINIARYILYNPEYVNFQTIKVEVPTFGYERTPLMIATDSQCTEIVELLLTHPNMTKKGINMVDIMGYTALHFTCIARGDEEFDIRILNLLLQDDRIDANIFDSNGSTPFIKAIDAYQYMSQAEKKVLLHLIKSDKVDINLTPFNDPHYSKPLEIVPLNKFDDEIVRAIRIRTPDPVK